LENINFSYSGSSKKILDNINLKINNNSITGIYGDSGSGKSTLLNIIACLLKPSSGRIYIDGKLLESDYKDFQNNIGYVTQKIYLTDESLIKNIAFGKNENDYDQKLLSEVIYKSNLTEVVKKLPEGIDTILGERGSKLSGGQQQRIGIARALYKKPKIIIFDEATSALDIDSETEILKTIQSLKREAAILIVSHKILFQDYCDSVYKFQDNKLIQIK
jgi:ABC-type bacteriocin/lantibiotic exporter with double-glycine peptidase domain